MDQNAHGNDALAADPRAWPGCSFWWEETRACRQLCVLQTTAKLIYIKNKEHTIPKWLGFVY